MNKRIDFTHLGGYPLDQDSLKFMQDSYRGALGAIASLCGNKTILYGVEVSVGNVSAGWISYNGELLPFIGGSYAAQVVIEETVVPLIFEDNAQHDVEFTKYATCGVVGDFPFSDLQPIRFALPAEIRELYLSNADLAIHFDVNGYGLSTYKGWRLLSKAYPGSAGKVMVNHDPGDATFNTCGNNGGSKTNNILKTNLPNVQINVTPSLGVGGVDNNANGGGYGYGVDKSAAPVQLKTAPLGDGTPLNNLQPYFVTVKIIKL